MKYAIISLFTGAGGLDYGLEAAGFETCVAVEMDRACCATLRHNRPDWTVLEGKVEDFSSDVILRAAGLGRRRADLLIGGPPCQPFSKSGWWRTGEAKRLSDPRSNTLRHYMRVLEDGLPKAFILENVFGIAYRGKDEGLIYLRKRLEQINRKHGTRYSFNWRVLNAAHFGVPQVRERVFIVGCREGRPFEFPEPRFFDPEESQGLLEHEKREPFRTAWDAFHDLDEPAEPLRVGGSWGYLLPSIPEGGNYLYHSDQGPGESIFKWRSRYWNFLLKLSKKRPSWTIQAAPGTATGPFHWNNRRLTTREMARLQTLPDNVEILGDRGAVQRQIGNAVPSAIGELLGLEIRRQFFGERVSSARLSLIPKRAKNSPRTTPTVPFHKLAGKAKNLNS